MQLVWKWRGQVRFTSKKSGCARTCVLFLLFFIALFIVPVAAGVDLVSFLPTLSNLKKKKQLPIVLYNPNAGWPIV